VRDTLASLPPRANRNLPHKNSESRADKAAISQHRDDDFLIEQL
jgi:hypothetical protein